MRWISRALVSLSWMGLSLAAVHAEAAEPRAGLLFQPADTSVLDLLVHPDIANQNRWFNGVEVGASLIEARQEILLPSWQPGFQVGRRFGRTGVFFHFEYNESFDFTQEVKKLEVYHLGVGVDHLFLYGRVRTALSTGLAILGTQTDFDEKGTKGWFLDARPLSVRFDAFGKGVFEVTPLGLNVSIPVARGIPLILLSYYTTVSLEFGAER